MKKLEENINSWARVLREADFKLGDRLYQNKTEQYQKLKKTGLPQYNKVENVEISCFLSNPEAVVSSLDSQRYFVSLIPKKQTMPRYGKAGIDVNQIVDYIKENIDLKNQTEYQITINEYFENLFGGNMVMGQHGEVYVEFKRGEQTDIARGKLVPEFIVTRERFTKSFRYSFQDKDIRKTIFMALLSVPCEGEGRNLRFMQGYYEFVIIRRSEKSLPEVIFIDYSDNPLFDLNWGEVNINISKEVD